MVSPKSIQSLLPLQVSAQSTMDHSGEWLQQPPKSAEESQVFDEVIALALLEETAVEGTVPGNTEDTQTEDHEDEEISHLSVGLTPQQDAWLAALALMPMQPVPMRPVPRGDGPTGRTRRRRADRVRRA